MLYEFNKGVNNKERGETTMRILNETDVMQVIDDKQKSFKTDVSLYQNEDPWAAEVAKWGIELLERVKTDIKALSFDATISQYKSPRAGDKG